MPTAPDKMMYNENPIDIVEFIYRKKYTAAVLGLDGL